MTRPMMNKGESVAKGSKPATGEQRSGGIWLIHLRLADPEVMPPVGIESLPRRKVTTSGRTYQPELRLFQES